MRKYRKKLVSKDNELQKKKKKKVTISGQWKKTIIPAASSDVSLIGTCC